MELEEVRPFWSTLEAYGDAIALIDERAGRRWTYHALARDVARAADVFRRGRKDLALLAIESTAESVVAYLGLLLAGHAVLLSSGIGGRALVERYRPGLVISRCAHRAEGYRAGPPFEGLNALWREGDGFALAEDLCLLLSTSGSTGAVKLTALSHNNVATAAQQVRVALSLTPGDRAITCLPMDHVFGLSVLHSQLAAGGSIVLNTASVIDRIFWERFDRTEATLMTGVPWSFQVMRDIGVDLVAIPSVRKIAQSGARLDRATLDWLIEAFPQDAVDIYLMYGQTEACGRIAVLPPTDLRSRCGAVGRAVPGGMLAVNADGEITYSGPNVMQGYVHTPHDLALDVRHQGALATGDLGHLDGSGVLYLTGRKTRVCKLLGNRFNLDDVQNMYSGCGPVAAVSDDNTLTICFEKSRAADIERRTGTLARDLRLPRQVIALRAYASLPRTAGGKIAYEQLATGVGG